MVLYALLGLHREGEGDSGSACKHFAGSGDGRELLIHLFLNTFIEHLLCAKLPSRSWDTSVNQTGKVH